MNPSNDDLHKDRAATSPIDSQLAAPSPIVPADSQHASSRRPRSEVMQLMDRPWMIVLLLLHLGFLGIPIYWKTDYSVATRLWIIFASIAYTVGAVVFIVVMLRWIASMLGI